MPKFHQNQSRISTDHALVTLPNLKILKEQTYLIFYFLLEIFFIVLYIFYFSACTNQTRPPLTLDNLYCVKQLLRSGNVLFMNLDLVQGHNYYLPNLFDTENKYLNLGSYLTVPRYTTPTPTFNMTCKSGR